jgi:hypothetical protein
LFANTTPAVDCRPLGVIGQHGIFLPERYVQVRDVPDDGDCFFHAFGPEVRNLFPRHASLPRQPEAGKSWRQLLLNYVQSTADTISGTNIRDWIVLLTGMEVDEYMRSTRVAAGRDT